MLILPLFRIISSQETKIVEETLFRVQTLQKIEVVIEIEEKRIEMSKSARIRDISRQFFDILFYLLLRCQSCGLISKIRSSQFI